MKRRQRHLCRVVTLVVFHTVCHLEMRLAGEPVLALMGDREVDHREEGLARLTLSPVGLPAALIPRIFRNREVVIRLRVVRAVVTLFAKQRGETANCLGEPHVAPHVLRSDRRRVVSGDDARPVHRTHRADPVRSGHPHAPLGQPVERRCRRKGVTVAAQIRTDIFTGDPQNVRTIVRDGSNRQNDTRYESRESKTSHRYFPKAATDVS